MVNTDFANKRDLEYSRSFYINYLFNLINIAIPNKISKTPTTIRTIHKILVNSKSKSEVVTVDDKVEEFVLEVLDVDLVDVLEVLVLDEFVLDVLVLVLDVFILTAAKV